MAKANGVEREPGEITAWFTPAAEKPASMACDQRKLSVPVSVIIFEDLKTALNCSRYKPGLYAAPCYYSRRSLRYGESRKARKEW
jgi:hypothetical protein